MINHAPRLTGGLYQGYKPRLPEFGHKLLPLPPYSPEYNPIEKTWAHIKKHLKKEAGTKVLASQLSLDCRARRSG